MKKWIRRIMALAIAAMLLAGAAVAEKETFSEGFRLPNIQVRPTAPAEEPAQSEEVEAEKTVLGNAVVTLSDAGSSLNIRAQASKDSEKVGALSNGEEVFILGTSGEWTNIRTANGVEGYVMTTYLLQQSAADSTQDAEQSEETVDPAPTQEVQQNQTGKDEALLVDAEGNPVLDMNGEQILSGEYEQDESGNLIFDENGRPIPVMPEEENSNTDGLRQIVLVLKEGETELQLRAEPSEHSEVLGVIPAGAMLYVKEIALDWCFAIYGGLEGYVLTERIALYNGQATPEEEEIIRTITVSSSVDGMREVYEGTEVVLTAEITGFEGEEVTYQWQITPDGGTTISDIEGATGASYAFVVDDSNAHCMWRVVVTIVGEVETAEVEQTQEPGETTESAEMTLDSQNATE